MTIVVIQQEKTNLNFCLLVCQFTENNTVPSYYDAISCIIFIALNFVFQLIALTQVPQFLSTFLFAVRGVPRNLCHQCQATHIYRSLQLLLSLVFKTYQTKYHNFSGQNTRQPTTRLKFKLVNKATGSSSRLTGPFRTIQICVLFTTVINSIVTFTVTSPLK